MKKILMSVMTMGIAVAMLGAGTFAYFTDDESSLGNTFTAGNLDLQLRGTGSPTWSDDPTGLITIADLAPGVETGSYYIGFKNVGDITGKVRATLDYTESDVSPQNGEFAGINVGATAFAKHLAVTYADVDGGLDVTPWWVQQIVDDLSLSGGVAEAITLGYVITIDSTNYPTIHGLSQIYLFFWSGYGHGNDISWPTGQVHTENLKFTLDPAVGNNYQFDGIEIEFIAEMTQFTAPW